MATWLEYKRLDGRNALGEHILLEKQLNAFLITVDPIDIVSVTFTTENDEYGIGHSVAHVVYKMYKIFKEDKPL